jgi:hypothetical protein
MIEGASAIRSYTAESIRPLLGEQGQVDTAFVNRSPPILNETP